MSSAAGCARCEAGAINQQAFRRGAPFPRPTLWLYGEDDPYYGIAHSRENFDGFVAAGGQGTFHAFRVPGDSHVLMQSPEV